MTLLCRWRSGRRPAILPKRLLRSPVTSQLHWLPRGRCHPGALTQGPPGASWKGPPGRSKWVPAAHTDRIVISGLVSIDVRFMGKMLEKVQGK